MAPAIWVLMIVSSSSGSKDSFVVDAWGMLPLWGFV